MLAFTMTKMIHYRYGFSSSFLCSRGSCNTQIGCYFKTVKQGSYLLVVEVRRDNSLSRPLHELDVLAGIPSKPILKLSTKVGQGLWSKKKAFHHPAYM